MDSQKIFYAFFDRLSVMQPLTNGVHYNYEVIHLDRNWGKLQQALKKYGRKINIFDPGRLGSVLVTSESPEITAAQVVDEFGIERLDDYFRQVMQFRKKEIDKRK